VKKCGLHNRVLVPKTVTWTDRFKRVRSMTIYVCPMPGCGKMRSNKRIKADVIKPTSAQL